jgi:hypothetical protein
MCGISLAIHHFKLRAKKPALKAKRPPMLPSGGRLGAKEN